MTPVTKEYRLYYRGKFIYASQSLQAVEAIQRTYIEENIETTVEEWNG